MAWMQAKCRDGKPCAEPPPGPADRIPTLRRVLAQYEEDMQALFYGNVGNSARDKLYSHVFFRTPDNQTFCPAAFTGYSRFGASFYAGFNNDCEVNTPNINNRLRIDNYDGWAIAERAPPEFNTTVKGLITTIPNNKLIAINTWEGLRDAHLVDRVSTYLATASAPYMTFRPYGGALSTPSEFIKMQPLGVKKINLNWWTSGPPEWQKPGMELRLRYFIDNNSDGTYDELYGFIEAIHYRPSTAA
jgi:hypothetical protein